MAIPVPTRILQPSDASLGNKLHDFKFATRLLAAAALPSTTNFFTAAPSADPTVDRYEQGNTLVTSGKRFTIYQMQVLVRPTNDTDTANLADIQRLIDFTFIRLNISQKEYGVFPLSALPQGGGISALGGQVSVTSAAAPGAFSTAGVTNGAPVRMCFAFQHPLIIQANQQFFAELVAPNGTGIVSAITLTGATMVRLQLEGVEERAAA